MTMECSPFLTRPLRSLSDVERARALETLRAAIEAAWSAAIAADESDLKNGLADLLSDCAELIREEDEAQEPCTPAAERRGCICRPGSIYEYDPEPIVNRFCPLHGSDDPDRAYDEARDDRMDAAE